MGGYYGIEKHHLEIAKLNGIKEVTFRDRVYKQGMSPDEACRKPVTPLNKRHKGKKGKLIQKAK